MITLRDTACWIVARRDGETCGDDEYVNTHYETEQEALAALPQYATDDLPVQAWHVLAEGFRCLTAVSICGDPFIYHGDYEVQHFAAEDDLPGLMRYSGLIEVSPGNWTCENKRCETCKAAVAESAERILAGAEPQVDGQQSLLDGEA